VMGVGLLVPTPSGYSSLQVLMMWVVMQGVGAADTLWNTGLNYVQITGSAYAQTGSSITEMATFSALFQGLSCDASMRLAYPDVTAGPASYFCTKNIGNPFCGGKPNFAFNVDDSLFGANKSAQPVVLLGPAGNSACGKLIYCSMRKSDCTANTVGSSAGTGAGAGAGIGGLAGPVGAGVGAGIGAGIGAGAGAMADSKTCALQAENQAALCKTQRAELAAIVPTLYSIAEKFAQVDYEYRNFYYNSYNLENRPAWILNYCSKMKVSDKECCVSSIAGAALSQKCKSPLGGGLFASLKPDPSTSSDFYVPSDEIVETLYWPAMDPNNELGGFIGTVVNEYTTAMATTMAANNTLDKDTNTLLKEAKGEGWIAAGGYYYMIAQQSKSSTQSPTLTWIPNSQTNPNQYRNLYTAAQSLIGLADESSGSGPGGASPRPSVKTAATAGLGNVPGFESLGRTVNSAGRDLSNFFVNMLKSEAGRDPLPKLISTGQALITLAEALWVALLLIVTVMAIPGNISILALGTGVTNPIGPGMHLIILFLLPAIYTFVGVLLGIGVTLAVYVPLIPFIFFTAGAIGWMIGVIEMLVAGPLVSLGILSPNSQHELLGKAEPALYHLFSIFLRPALMVFGMFSAMLLSSVALLLLNQTFSLAISGIASGGYQGGIGDPLLLICFLAVYVTLVVSVLNKAFSVIHVLPDRVLSWIGGHHGQPGGAGGEAEMAGKAERGTESAGHAARGGLGKAAGGIEATRGRAEKQAAYDKGKEKEGEASKSGVGTGATPPEKPKENPPGGGGTP